MNNQDQPPAERLGLLQIYTGNGKGKTTAALGLALRAAGHGMRTYIGQFLKGRAYGELESLKRLTPTITLEQYGLDDWVRTGQVTPEQRQAALDGLDKARQALLSNTYDIVILDEITMALHLSVLTEKEVLDLIESRPAQTELVLTGRHAPQAILDRADLVTEMQEVRHPLQRGVAARPGIEF